MHVIYLLPPIERYSPVSGGAIATVAMQQAKFLLHEGWTVTILGPQHPDPVYKVGRFIGVHGLTGAQANLLDRIRTRVHKQFTDWPWPAYDRYVRSIKRYLRTERPDAVVCFNDLDLPSVLRRTFPQMRIILRLSNEVTRPTNIARRGLDAVDFITPVSKYIAHWTNSRYGPLDIDRVHVIPNGADIETFHPREGYDHPSPTLRVLFVGRIDPNKGPDLAADVVATLQAEGYPVSCTFAGARWFYGSHEPNAYELELDKKARACEANMLGHVTREHLPQIVREHDVLLMLSRSEEPMGQVQFEAMASGLAVIGSKRGGIPEALGETGVLFEPEDRNGVAGQLREWLKSPDCLSRAKRASLMRAHAMTWHHNAMSIKKLLSPTNLGPVRRNS